MTSMGLADVRERDAGHLPPAQDIAVPEITIADICRRT